MELSQGIGTRRQTFEPIDFRTRFPALDGIRALAVTAVFLAHYGGGGTHGGTLLRFLNAVREYGTIGVDLFFVLSGFLITGILYDTRADSRFFQRFFGRRTVRIFPIVYLLFAVLALLTPIVGYEWRWGHLYFLVYLGNFFGNRDFSLYSLVSTVHPYATATLSHLWSLCVEEQFYLLWPIAVWAIADRVKLLWTSVGLSAVSVLLRLAAVLFLTPDTAERWIVRTLPFRLDSLLIGAILALLLRGPAADQVQRACKSIFVAGVAGLAVIKTFSPSYLSPWVLTLGLLCTAVASMGLIGATLRRQSIAFRIFHWGPARILGKYSYGFYVWHLVWQQAFILLLSKLFFKTHSTAISGLIEVPLAFVASFLLAKLSYDLFEVRFLKLKHYFEYDSEIKSHRTAFAADGN